MLQDPSSSGTSTIALSDSALGAPKTGPSPSRSEDAQGQAMTAPLEPPAHHAGPRRAGAPTHPIPHALSGSRPQPTSLVVPVVNASDSRSVGSSPSKPQTQRGAAPVPNISASMLPMGPASTTGPPGHFPGPMPPFKPIAMPFPFPFPSQPPNPAPAGFPPKGALPQPTPAAGISHSGDMPQPTPQLGLGIAPGPAQAGQGMPAFAPGPAQGGKVPGGVSGVAVGGGTLQGPGGGPPKAMPKLRGVGMLGLHPMVQLAGWGPISLQLGPHRAAQLQRYRYKRMLRMRALATGEKRIRYQCRKQLADARPRVKGRFAKIHGPDGLLAKQREEAAAALTAQQGSLSHHDGKQTASDSSTRSASTLPDKASAGGGPLTDATSGGVNPKGMRRSKSRVGLSKGLEVPTAAKAPKNTSKATRAQRKPREGAAALRDMALAGRGSFMRAVGGPGAMNRVMSEMNLAQLDEQAHDALNEIIPQLKGEVPDVEEAGEGLEEMIHLTNDWGGQMVGGEREALESGGMIGHGGEGERSGVGQEDDLQEFGELDEFLGLSKKDANMLLREVAAADMRRSFSDTNLLSLDTSRIDFDTALETLREDDEFGALGWR